MGRLRITIGGLKNFNEVACGFNFKESVCEIDEKDVTPLVQRRISRLEALFGKTTVEKLDDAGKPEEKVSREKLQEEVAAADVTLDAGASVVDGKQHASDEPEPPVALGESSPSEEAPVDVADAEVESDAKIDAGEEAPEAEEVEEVEDENVPTTVEERVNALVEGNSKSDLIEMAESAGATFSKSGTKAEIAREIVEHEDAQTDHAG